MRKGILIILSGPSGSGKGTVVSELVKDDSFVLSISATTRKPRDYETEAVHYFFKTKDEFDSMIQNEELLEHACFCGNFYGTPKDYVIGMLNKGKNVILEIEVQGALKVKNIYPECVLVFMIPPNRCELKKRLKGRGTEDDETITKRTERALEEIEESYKYDYIVVNDYVENAVKSIKNIVLAELCKVSRNKNMISEFKGEI